MFPFKDYFSGIVSFCNNAEILVAGHHNNGTNIFFSHNSECVYTVVSGVTDIACRPLRDKMFDIRLIVQSFLVSTVSYEKMKEVYRFSAKKPLDL